MTGAGVIGSHLIFRARGVLSALTLWLFTAAAAADPPPRVSRILWSEDDRSVLLVTNRGLVFGDAVSKQFRLMCNQALDVGVGDIPTLARLSDGRWLAATTAGLKTSADGGCTWQAAPPPLDTTQTPAMVQHPVQKDTLYIAAYGPGQSGIRITRDAGRSFTTALDMADNEFTHSLVIAPSDHDRIYAAGLSFDKTGKFSHYLLRSSNGGGTWQRFPVELELLDDRASVVAVRPDDEQELLLKTTTLQPHVFAERLLRSRDGGESFSVVLERELLSDASYVASGASVWVAGVAGLWRSIDDLASFQRQGVAEQMSCVTSHDGLLWGCGQFAGMASGKDGIGSSSDGQSFSPWMDFRDIDQPITCPPDAQTALVCQAAWAHWRVEVLGITGPDVPDASGGNAGTGPDGGIPAGSGGDAGDPPRAKPEADFGAPRGGGCNIHGVRRTETRHVLSLLIALCTASRTARRRARRSARINPVTVH